VNLALPNHRAGADALQASKLALGFVVRQARVWEAAFTPVSESFIEPPIALSWRARAHFPPEEPDDALVVASIEF
jgi:hypothetical protein